MRQTIWQKIPWSVVAVAIPLGFGAIFWGGSINSRVDAAERTTIANKTEIIERLERIEVNQNRLEDKLDRLIARLAQ